MFVFYFQMLSYMYACSTYYHQGSDLCEDLDSFLKSLADEVKHYFYHIFQWTKSILISVFKIKLKNQTTSLVSWIDISVKQTKILSNRKYIASLFHQLLFLYFHVMYIYFQNTSKNKLYKLFTNQYYTNRY